MTESICIVGSGKMAGEYARTLTALKKNFFIIGRDKKELNFFYRKYGVKVYHGGLKKTLLKEIMINSVIVATTIDNLAECCCDLINHGATNILLEKPGALSINSLKKIKRLSLKRKVKIHIAYNRRFYQSIITLKRMIKKDEYITSCFFDFTEKTASIEKSNLSKKVKSKMIYSNSSHIFDLVFYLCGYPKEIKSFINRKLDWHPSAACFSGSGKTNKNIIFSYFADWGSAGRWKIDLRTNKRNYILQPLEDLCLMEKNNFKVVKIPNSSKLDKLYKPGIYLQTKAFLSEDFKNFCSIDDQILNFKYMKKVGNYPKE